MGLRLKKGDLVEVIAGKDKSRPGQPSRGVILRVLPKKNKAVVEGINLIKRHQKQRSENEPAGIITREAPIDMSNLMIVDPETDKPTRFYTKVEEQDGRRRKVRVSKTSGKEL